MARSGRTVEALAIFERIVAGNPAERRALRLAVGAAVTLLAVLLSDATWRQYMQGRDVALLVVVAILESFGYRQLNSLWGCVGTVQALSGKGGWVR